MTSYLEKMFGLQGKSVIITGATGGLGSAMATALAGAGADEIISIELPDDRLSVNLIKSVEEAGSKVRTFTCDIRDRQQLEQCYEKIWAAGAVPDVLVNCAGVQRRSLCEDTSAADLDILLDINVKSTFISMQCFGRRLLSLKRPGKIINIASVTSFQAGFNCSAYAASKGAVLQMTKAFSNEWSPKGIQVNCIHPGYMQTVMTAVYRDDQKMDQYLMDRVPMARWGQPEDLAAAAVFLAAPGNKYMSGAPLIIDGGFCGK